jgi:hypothetical protein
MSYRSKSARLGAALGAGLFGPGPEEKPMRRADDAQASIRSALRRRRRTLGLTQEDTAGMLGMSRMTYLRAGGLGSSNPTQICLESRKVNGADLTNVAH